MLLLQSLQGQQMGHGHGHGHGGFGATNPLLLASLFNNECAEPGNRLCTPPNEGTLCGVDDDTANAPDYLMCCECPN